VPHWVRRFKDVLKHVEEELVWERLLVHLIILGQVLE
jgi:hypothetical protein